jgi:hypothetical protein
VSALAGSAPPTDLRIGREALVSGAINAVLSLAFFLLAFDAWERVAVWGVGGYVMDFLPQSFAIGLMATLVPGLLARRRLGRTRRVPSAGSVIARSLAHALLALMVGGVFWAAAAWISEGVMMGWSPALAIKLIYGGALGAAVTALSLRRMLG